MDLTRKIVWGAMAAFDALVWGVIITLTFGWGAIVLIVAGLAAALTLYVGGWCCEGSEAL